MTLTNLLETIRGEVEIRVYKGGATMYTVKGNAENIDAYYMYNEPMKVISIKSVDSVTIIKVKIPMCTAVDI